MATVYGPASLTLSSYSNTLLVGSTGAGKSSLCMDICLNRDKVYDKKVEKVVYLINDHQAMFENARQRDKNIIFTTTIEEFESEIKENQGTRHYLCVFDDFVCDAIKGYSTYVLEFMLRRSHHQKYSVLFNTQLLYPSNSFRRVTLNCHYYIFFRNHHESQLHYFLRSVSPSNWRNLLEIYQNCVKEKKFSYFFMSIHPSTPEILRLRSFVIPTTGGIVYNIT